MLTKEQANAIWNILVEYAGAYADNRDEFIDVQTDSDTIEYRFGGNLGFGGKFWINRNEWYVNCYREDMNDLRQETLDNTNVALKRLKQKFDEEESMNV